ncbi:hypothetical protein [Blastococcus sp. CT_GayMR16]|uniref:hypothetical protein n=1 Tax=Blastococcus sp. CT_GayMR16 TaxID=2559607 RepID=UPI001073EAE1|nr:hypothetical protein [Blastococcus sp. CT_GayMR16]TFV89901.1 hypothetical protein E4P38_05460 [Blastococcus sp. CT_GayMR16]
MSLDLNDSGQGTLTIRASSPAEYKGVLAYLAATVTIVGGDGGARRLQLGDPLPADPSTYPAVVTLPVTELDLPPDSVTQRMAFGNNMLQSGCWVDVISFDPPTEAGAEGMLRVHCATEADYLEVRRFLDEEHGSALKSTNGGLWYVGRVSDDAAPVGEYPQNVNFRLEWRHRM